MSEETSPNVEISNTETQPTSPPAATATTTAAPPPPASGKLINSTVGNEGKLFVGGLAKSTTADSLRQYFESFGAVKDVSVKIDPHTQQSRGFGFVLFEDESSIQKVAEAAPHSLDGRKIDPKKAERRDGKMFVGGVKGETSDETIIEYFEKFGLVETVDRPVDKSTGKNKSFCFVTFKKDGIMKAAVKERFHEIDGKRCETKEGVPKQDMQHHQHQHQGGYGGYRGGWGSNYANYGQYHQYNNYGGGYGGHHNPHGYQHGYGRGGHNYQYMNGQNWNHGGGWDYNHGHRGGRGRGGRTGGRGQANGRGGGGGGAAGGQQAY